MLADATKTRASSKLMSIPIFLIIVKTFATSITPWFYSSHEEKIFWIFLLLAYLLLKALLISLTLSRSTFPISVYLFCIPTNCVSCIADECVSCLSSVIFKIFFINYYFLSSLIIWPWKSWFYSDLWWRSVSATKNFIFSFCSYGGYYKPNFGSYWGFFIGSYCSSSN